MHCPFYQYLAFRLSKTYFCLMTTFGFNLALHGYCDGLHDTKTSLTTAIWGAIIRFASFGDITHRIWLESNESHNAKLGKGVALT
jgi:hypothetical protein